MPLVISHSKMRRTYVVAGLLAACLSAGCAAETAGWPQMSDFSRITQKVLTPKEQDQAIQDMTAEQKAEQAKALKTIEKK
jgi:hypothetical protein